MEAGQQMGGYLHLKKRKLVRNKVEQLVSVFFVCGSTVVTIAVVIV
jgi:hypothetical protein